MNDRRTPPRKPAGAIHWNPRFRTVDPRFTRTPRR
jgi:hypothetical protein